ncbi:hypothetical protein ACFL1R_07370 [Candidatus Latescibacterota bacterium]
MPNINEINTTVYKLLNGDDALSGLCTVYKGAKRPSKFKNPSVTAAVKNLQRGDGEGLWMCDVVVSVYVDILENRMPDHENMETISSRIRDILSDTEIDLVNAKAHPLIQRESSGSEWDSMHDNETVQENTLGMVFVKFS